MTVTMMMLMMTMKFSVCLLQTRRLNYLSVHRAQTLLSRRTVRPLLWFYLAFWTTQTSA